MHAAILLTLMHYGVIPVLQNGDITMVKEFRMAYGDTSRQDSIANSPGRAMSGPFGMNAANYYQNADGSWNLFNFKLPAESLRDKNAAEERQDFRDYLDKPKVKAILEDPHAKTDFGRPGDFIYRRMGLPSHELPAPFNRLSKEALAPLQHILQYNEDGSMKIYIKQPLDQDGQAQQVFSRIVDELERAR